MNHPRRKNAPRKGTMFPHTVTVYNTAVEYDADYNETLTNHITVLHGVFLEASKAVNVRASGLESADAVNLYVPFSVHAVDGVTGRERTYIPPVEFWRLEDHASAWTLAAGGGSASGRDTSTFFIKGEVVEADASMELIELKYDGVYSVTKVDEKDFGALPHWEIGGS